jgi:HSP20 family protein
MPNDKSNTDAAATAMSKDKSMTTTPKNNGSENQLSPIFVEAEKMFERFAELTRETSKRAFEFFKKRGGELGRELDDWFKAESEILRPVPVEITETDGQIKVTAAVPGFKAEEIQISVKDNTLILSGRTEREEKKEDENTFYSEFRSDHFFRQLILPTEVDAEKTQADLKDGVLQLTMPKLPAREAAQIAVTAK